MPGGILMVYKGMVSSIDGMKARIIPITEETKVRKIVSEKKSR